MHSHAHGLARATCEHEKVSYCKTCFLAYCENCGQEFTHKINTVPIYIPPQPWLPNPWPIPPPPLGPYWITQVSSTSVVV